MTKNHWIVVALFVVLVIGVATTFSVLRPMRKEESTQKSVAVETDIDKRLIGTWKNTEDSKYTVVFMPGGRLSEQYESRTASEGTWEISPGKDLFQLKKTIDGEIFLYEIVTVTDSNLTLIYLPRGNTLTFKKMNEN